jgi:hypothetical protein
MFVRSGVVTYIAFGFLFQYLAYGDMPLNLVSTWLHILFWLWILIWWFLYYAIIVVAIVVVVVFIGRRMGLIR